MNAVFRNTVAVAAALGLLLAVDLVVHAERASESAEPPSIPKVAIDQVHTVRLTKGDTITTIERDGEAWKLTSPIAFPADPTAVKGLLQTFGEPVPMDLRVDVENHEDYGLESPDVVFVEVLAESAPIASFYVGNNGPGGASFVRFPGDDTVWSGRVGGRHRYDRAPSEWRDHRVLDFDPGLATELLVDTRDHGSFAFVRRPEGMSEAGAAQLGAWADRDVPDFPLDQRSVQEAVGALGRLRAGEILSSDHPSGTDDPAATVSVRLQDGTEHVLLFGRTADGTFVRRGGGNEVYRVSNTAMDRIVRDRIGWRDRQLVDLERDAVVRVTLIEPMYTSVLERAADGAWKVTKPVPLSTDGETAQTAVRLAAGLRADELVAVGARPAGFPSDTRLVVSLGDGTESVVEVGNLVPDRKPGQEAVYVRAADRPDEIGTLAATTWSRIKKVFAR